MSAPRAPQLPRQVESKALILRAPYLVLPGMTQRGASLAFSFGFLLLPARLGEVEVIFRAYNLGFRLPIRVTHVGLLFPLLSLPLGH